MDLLTSLMKDLAGILPPSISDPEPPPRERQKGTSSVTVAECGTLSQSQQPNKNTSQSNFKDKAYLEKNHQARNNRDKKGNPITYQTHNSDRKGYQNNYSKRKNEMKNKSMCGPDENSEISNRCEEKNKKMISSKSDEDEDVDTYRFPIHLHCKPNHSDQNKQTTFERKQIGSLSKKGNCSSAEEDRQRLFVPAPIRSHQEIDRRFQRHDQKNSNNYNYFLTNYQYPERNERLCGEEFKNYQQDRKQNSNWHDNQNQLKRNGEPRGREFRKYQYDRNETGNLYKQNQASRGERWPREEFRNYQHDRNQSGNLHDNGSNKNQERIDERQPGGELRNCQHGRNQTDNLRDNGSNKNQERKDERQPGEELKNYQQNRSHYQQNRSQSCNRGGNQNFQNRGRRYNHGKKFNNFDKQEINDHRLVQGHQRLYQNNYRSRKDNAQFMCRTNFSHNESSRPSSVQSTCEIQEGISSFSLQNMERPSSSQSNYQIGQRGSNYLNNPQNITPQARGHDFSGHRMKSTEYLKQDSNFHRENLGKFGKSQNSRSGFYDYPLNHRLNKHKFLARSQDCISLNQSSSYSSSPSVKRNNPEGNNTEKQDESKQLNRRSREENFNRKKNPGTELKEDNTELLFQVTSDDETQDEEKNSSDEVISDTEDSEESRTNVDEPFHILSVDFRNNFPLNEEEAIERNIDLNEEVKDILLLGKEGDVVITEQPKILRDIMVFMQKFPNATAVTLKD